MSEPVAAPQRENACPVPIVIREWPTSCPRNKPSYNPPDATWFQGEAAG